MQAFRFALDATDVQRASIFRHFGARRFVYNWVVSQLKTDIEHFHLTGKSSGEKPSWRGMRKKWNRVKDTVAVDSETGELWWKAVSKEAFSTGVRDAVEALELAVFQGR